MTQQNQDKSLNSAMELLIDNGFEGAAEAIAVLLNTAMAVERSAYLDAQPYERTAERRGYANGFKDKTLKTRLGALPLKVPQTRDGGFYPQSLENGLRSERAMVAGVGVVSRGQDEKSTTREDR